MKPRKPAQSGLNWNRAMHVAVGLVVLWAIYRWAAGR